MIMLFIRLVFIAAILAGLYLIIKALLKPSDTIKCGRCEGRGYWLAARGRETCDWCKGTGRLPNLGKPH